MLMLIKQNLTQAQDIMKKHMINIVAMFLLKLETWFN